jgi:purine-cytosine permease-like protein
LVYAGMNDKQVWLVFLLIAMLSTFTAMLGILFAKWGNPWMSVFLTLYFVVVFFFLYRNTIIYKR